MTQEPRKPYRAPADPEQLTSSAEALNTEEVTPYSPDGVTNYSSV